ncbi:transmembrane 6 superfamily member 2 [Melospiza georgiana]|uniref:transmembrane 6 superfamily member 2 n=1 Tax=Melospiza georgiana TaxID=44398 RepID=UPI0025ACC167|nr:transmembrane 6 superfamily member 2 [Melospiza georgiana]
MQLPAGPAALAAPLLALPVALGLSAVSALDSPPALALAAALLLLGLGALLILTGGVGLVHDPLFCVLVVFSFISAVDLLIALEEDGLISGFMELYVREGDPHLRTAHGLLTCYWDGTVHYGLCLAMAAAAGRRKNYRGLGLFWLGSLLMSAVVFLLGNLIGKYSPELSPSFLLNLPYLLLLTWAGLRLFRQPRARPSLSPEQIAEEQRKPLYQRPQDLLLILILILTAAFTFFRGMVVLDCPADSCFDYTYLHEPYLRDPVGYPKVQMLIYLFYLLPFLILAIYGLAVPGCSWLPDWSLVFAGAVAQAQFAHLGSSLHSRTPFPYQTPEEVLWSFLLSNALYALGPQLLALRCLRAPAFFAPPAGPGLARAKKCQ